MVELAGISAWLAQREATVPALRPGCEKRIQWAAKEDRQTQWSVVFIRGFSASPGELSPMPQMIALNLRANLFLTRLTGHWQMLGESAQAERSFKRSASDGRAGAFAGRAYKPKDVVG